MRLAFAGLLLALGCSDASETREPSQTPSLPITVDALEVEVVLPGTRALVRGSGFLEDVELTATLEGTLGGAAIALELGASRVDDRAAEVRFDAGQVRELGAGVLEGTLALHARLGEARGVASASVRFEVAQSLGPVIGRVPAGVFPSTPVVIRGEGFIRGGEGQTLVALRGQYVRDSDGLSVPIEVSDAVALPLDEQDRLTESLDWGRQAVGFEFDPGWVGIEPGVIDAELRLINAGDGWTRESSPLGVRFDLLPPAVEAIEPKGASRGQRIQILGQGFVPGEGQGYTVLRLQGEFLDRRSGESAPLPEGGLDIIPLWVSGNELAFTFTVDFEIGARGCVSADIGANPGFLEGTVTPVIAWGAQVVEGSPAPLSFEILPAKQVVHLSFLPAFTDSLRLFGLRNVSGAVKARILEVVRRDYEGINLELRTTEPLDFIQYSVVEIGGPDPNQGQLFGLDNTPDLDHCNRRLDDNLAGRNIDGGGFGGIFVESFLQLSPAPDNENPLASPIFDEIFDAIMRDPVEPGEYPGGGRDATIERAIRTLGNLVGNTVTHEVGHSLGLTRVPGCGQFHNTAGEGTIMDCGQDRPFEERAGLASAPPPRWHPDNLEYLQQIMPL